MNRWGAASVSGLDTGRVLANVVTGNVSADVVLIEGADPTDQIRDAILDDATRFSGGDVGTILGDTNDLQTRIPAALVGGRMDSDLQRWGSVSPNGVVQGVIPVVVQTSNDKTGYSIAVGGIDSTAFATGAVDAAALAQDAAQEIADELLNRDIAGGGSGNTRNVRNSLRVLRNRTQISTILTVFQEDDAATAWTASVITVSGAGQLTEVNPA